MKIFLLFCAILSILYLISLNFLTNDINAILEQDLNFSQYTNPKYDFSIKYPASWDLSEIKSKSMENLVNVEIKSNFDGPQDMIQEKFVISINKLPRNLDLNKYVDEALKQINSTYQEFKLISDQFSEKDNIQSRTISYSYLAGIPPISTKIVMTTEIFSYGDKVYVLSFGTPPNKYYDLLPVMNEIFESFQILNRPQMIYLYLS
ncbi:MAG: DUF1795 domain-containing protein [Nitrososphaeraceae archaeon]|nr:DUF1795 domain-containing protein [Nitrososphaeraceae archaeon]